MPGSVPRPTLGTDFLLSCLDLPLDKASCQSAHARGCPHTATAPHEAIARPWCPLTEGTAGLCVSSGDTLNQRSSASQERQRSRRPPLEPPAAASRKDHKRMVRCHCSSHADSLVAYSARQPLSQSVLSQSDVEQACALAWCRPGAAVLMTQPA